MLWQKMPYFADAIAHTALLGVVIGIACNVDPSLGVIVVSLSMVALFFRGATNERKRVWVMMNSYFCLSIALFAIRLVPTLGAIDVSSYLFGDILLVSIKEAMLLLLVAMIWLIWMRKNLRSLLLLGVDKDLARIHGISPLRLRLTLLAFASVFIGGFVKVLGSSLAIAATIMPSVAARNCTNSPGRMICLSMLFGAIGSWLGITASFLADVPSGPAITTAFFMIFCLTKMVR